MKLTITIIALLSLSAVWAKKEKKAEEVKESKRDAEVGYPSVGLSQSFHGSSLGHGDASAISIGAGYSVGGGKPTYSFGSHDAGPLQYSQDSLPGNAHSSIQLAPITLQHDQGNYISSDLSQLMSQISHGINSGAISLAPNVGELHLSSIQGGHGQAQAQAEQSYPQFSYGAPKLQLQQYSVHEPQASPPSYAAGHKGLGSYGTGPVLFNPAESAGHQQPALNLNSVGGHSFGDSGLSFGGGNSFAGLSSLGGSGHGHAGHGHSIGNIKALGGGYQVVGSGKPSFKPSAFLGSSSQNEHAISGLSYGSPSFSGHQLSGGHGLLSLGSGGHGGSLGGSLGGFGGGHSKLVAHSYLPSKPSFHSGGSLDSVAYASHDHSPPRTTYGLPSASLGSSSLHSASSVAPQYYLSSSKHPSSSHPSSSFGHGSSSYRAPSPGHSSLGHSGPKYTFVSHAGPSSRYASSKDIQGAYSEPVYNTIKYSEALKSHAH